MVQLELGANATAQLLWAEGTARARIIPDDSHSGEWLCPAPALKRESKRLMCARNPQVLECIRACFGCVFSGQMPVRYDQNILFLPICFSLHRSISYTLITHPHSHSPCSPFTQPLFSKFGSYLPPLRQKWTENRLFLFYPSSYLTLLWDCRTDGQVHLWCCVMEREPA